VQERAAQFDPNQVEEKAEAKRSARSVHQYHADRVYSGGSSFSTTGRRFKHQHQYTITLPKKTVDKESPTQVPA